MAQTQLDVLAVGDVVTDAFIRLLDHEARVVRGADGPRLSMPYASKVPYDHDEIVPAVGNSANAAVAFAKLGFKAGLITNIGDDPQGREILSALHDAKVDRRFVHVNPGKHSNYHYVLWYKSDRTILIKHEQYAYHWPRFRAVDVPDWIYFSSVSEHAVEYHEQLAEWLDDNPNVKLAFQPGTFQLQAGPRKLHRIYERSEILAVNREEASLISGGHHHDVRDLFKKLHALGPKIVVISDGPDGAYASDGQSSFKMPIYPDPKEPYDRTGAGDAFTSTFVASIMRGADIEQALLWAPINSMSVVQKTGAQAGLLTQDEIEHYLSLAPKWYHPERIA